MFIWLIIRCSFEISAYYRFLLKVWRLSEDGAKLKQYGMYGISFVNYYVQVIYNILLQVVMLLEFDNISRIHIKAFAIPQ